MCGSKMRMSGLRGVGRVGVGTTPGAPSRASGVGRHRVARPPRARRRSAARSRAARRPCASSSPATSSSGTPTKRHLSTPWRQSCAGQPVGVRAHRGGHEPHVVGAQRVEEERRSRRRAGRRRRPARGARPASRRRRRSGRAPPARPAGGRRGPGSSRPLRPARPGRRPRCARACRAASPRAVRRAAAGKTRPSVDGSCRQARQHLVERPLVASGVSAARSSAGSTSGRTVVIEHLRSPRTGDPIRSSDARSAAMVDLATTGAAWE